MTVYDVVAWPVVAGLVLLPFALMLLPAVVWPRPQRTHTHAGQTRS